MKYKTVLLLILITIVAGFVFFNKSISSKNTPSSSREKLETFLIQNRANDQVAEAYLFALDNPQGVLSKVRCYCGCIRNQGHKNNRNCFIDEDGSLDNMGLNCGLCVKTALISKQMLSEGKTVQQISDYVDATFGKL